jgi:hypothetical protein
VQWTEAAAAADVTSAVQRAARAAWDAARSEETAAAAVGAGGGTLLQLSSWRHSHPLERARRPPAHALVDWLHPVCAAVALLETRVLACSTLDLATWLTAPSSHDSDAETTTAMSVVQRLAACQEWR